MSIITNSRLVTSMIEKSQLTRDVHNKKAQVDSNVYHRKQ